MKKIIKTKINFQNLIELLILLLFSLPVLIPLMGPGMILTHDQYFPLHRLMAMEKCYHEGQFPPRWTDLFGMGYGYPFFNFYAPLAYLTGLLFLGIWHNPVWAMHIVFGLSLLIGGIGVWLWLKRIFDSKAALVAGILYNCYPYHLVNAYVRGDISELLASALFPWVLWGFTCIDSHGSKRYAGMLAGSFFFCLVLLSHNIMALLFTGFLTAWIIFKSLRNWKLLIFAGGSYLGGLGLSAFFWLPAFYEKKYVNIAGLLQDAPYHEHFLYWYQLLLLNWGYGGSCAGPGDGMSFQLGIVFLMTVMIGIILLFLNWKKYSIDHREETLFWLGAGCSMLFFMLPLSLWFWDHMPLMRYVLYPWRFLSLAALPMAFMTALLLGPGLQMFLKERKIQYISLMVVFIAMSLIYPCLGARHVRVPEEIYLRRTVWAIESATGTYGTTMSNEYLPLWVRVMPSGPADYLLGTSAGVPIQVRARRADSYWKIYEFELPQKQEVVIPVFYYPGWEVYSKGKLTPFKITPNGFLKVELAPGYQVLEIRFRNTPLRLIANSISLIFWFFWLLAGIVLVYARRNWKNKL